MGTAARFNFNGNRRLVFGRKRSNVTSVSGFPLNLSTIAPLLRFFPNKVSWFADKILSPACIPTFSLGPFSITRTIFKLSSIIKKLTPMPTNSPCIFSLTKRSSSSGIKAECGSNRSITSSITKSTKLSVSILST